MRISAVLFAATAALSQAGTVFATTTTATEVASTTAANTTSTAAPPPYQGPYVKSPTEEFLFAVLISGILGAVLGVLWHMCVQPRYDFTVGADNGYSSRTNLTGGLAAVRASTAPTVNMSTRASHSPNHKKANAGLLPADARREGILPGTDMSIAAYSPIDSLNHDP